MLKLDIEWRQGTNLYFYYVFRYTNPIEILPGDEISVTCTYNTKTVNDYIYEGDATSDEMCFGILIYYPYVSSRKYMINKINYIKGSENSHLIVWYKNNAD